MNGKRGVQALVATSALALVVSVAGQADAQSGPYFVRTATLPVYQNLPQGTDPASPTAAEIVAALPDGNGVVYTDSPGERIGFVAISDPAAPQPDGTLAVGGEPTTVMWPAATSWSA